MGAAYLAIQRGIPAIAFSSGNNDPKPYYLVNTTTQAGYQDPATITARLASNLVQAMIDKANGGRVLPEGYGMSVNLPYITSDTSDECINPPFILTEMTGTPSEDRAVFDSQTKLFTHHTSGVTVGPCGDGNCTIPREQDVLNAGCMSSVTLFTVNYNSPFHQECVQVMDVEGLIPIVVQFNGTTPLIGGLGANASVTGNSSSPPTPLSPSPPVGSLTVVVSMGKKVEWTLNTLLLGIGLLALQL